MTLRPTLVLASSSIRRQQLLKCAGIDFVCCPAHIAELRMPQEPGLSFAERMAREKAHAVRPKMPGHAVLGADTVVEVEKQVLGKPANAEDAARMLRLLSGRSHQVTTGVCLVGDGFDDLRSETTKVYFLPLAENDIEEYVATGEPLDKAGAYAIQGKASRFIQYWEGDYTNVVGLPLGLVRRMLLEHGIIRSD
ncbi:MAG: septum formation protein Maf [Acidobacteria bacterium]|nr:septum formation protein Maf [Acidobacteriota bacterium]